MDCTVRACAVVTRADHTRNTDRSQDVRIPVTFKNESATRWWLVLAGAAVLLGLLVTGWLLRRRRRRRRVR